MSQIKPTYHLPPNFSTPPPPAGPFHLGIVIKDFKRREQMRLLNHGKDKNGNDKRVEIPENEIYLDYKCGFEATRSQLKSGELGLWAKFAGVDGIGAEASISAERSENDTYKFASVETKYFYPSASYILQCMALSDVGEYMKVWKYKHPVHIVTGLKVAKGACVRMEGNKELKAKFSLGLNNPGGTNVQVGPSLEGKGENKAVVSFTGSSDIVVGIQCLKVYYKNGWFGGRQLRDEVYIDGATFHGDESRSQQEVQFDDLVLVSPEDYNNPNLAFGHQAAEGGKEDEIWILPAGPD